MKPLMILDQHFRKREELFDVATFEALGRHCRIEGGEDAPMDPDRLAQLLPEATFLVAARPNVSEADLAAAPNLRAIIEVSGAFHGEIDYAACFERGIEVLSCAPGFRYAVAEMGLGLLLAACRGLVAEHEAFREGRESWLDDRPGWDFSLFGQTIGFVGYGNIARELHALLRPFSPKVLAYDPWLTTAPDGVTLVSLPDLFDRSRAVLVTAVPSEDNRAMIDDALIARMGKGAALVLLSRAHVVDFDAAVAAADNGAITFATDVFPSEPAAPDHPVRTTRNVILSPHRAAAVDGGRQPIGRFILHDVEAILSGAPERQLLKADKARVEGLVRAQHLIEQSGKLANT